MSRARHVHPATVIALALFSLITLTVSPMQAADVYLTWDAPEVDAQDASLTNPVGYKVYYGPSTRGYEGSIDVGNMTSIILTDLEEGHTYYVTVTAYDEVGVESDFANEVSFLVSGASLRPAGLVAAYGFDEGSGALVADASGHGNDGVISGAIWTSAGRFGNALFFDGLAAWVTIEDVPSLHVSDGMTLSAWVYPIAMQSGWRTIVQKDAGAYFLHTSWDEGALSPAGGGAFDDGGTSITVPRAIPVNAWSHLALTYDGTMLRFYVDGEEIAGIPQTGRLEVEATPLWIGGNGVYDEYFAGQIDEVRLYNRALSPSEIQADMNLPVSDY